MKLGANGRSVSGFGVRGRVVCAGLAMGLLGASNALAAVPPVLDRVPDNAMFVVAMPGADQFHKHMTDLLTAIEQQLPVPEIADLLAMGGITEGIQTDKSMALVVFPPKRADGKAAPAGEGGMTEMEEPRAVGLVPITSYEKLLTNFAAKPAGEGKVDHVTMTSGEEVFVKDVGGGYAVMGDNEELVSGFQAKSGASPIKSKLGKAGASLADSSDVIAIVNIDSVRAMWPELKKELESAIKEQAENLPMGGEAPNPMQNEAVTWVLDSAIRDGQSVVIGMSTGSTGMHMDLSLNFTEGSPMGKMFNSTGNAGSLLSKLPAGPYLFAYAMDMSNADMKKFFKDVQGKSGATQQMGLDLTGSLENSEGSALAVGMPQGGLLGGVFTSTVMYTKAKDPAALVAAAKEQITKLNGTGAEGLAMESSYKEAGAKVDNKDVDVFDIKMKMDEGSPVPPQLMNGLFGPTGGPNGYIAKTDGGMYMTYSKNSALMASAMNVGKGTEALTSDKLMGQVAGSLPPNRVIEGYVGTKTLMDLLLPVAAMFGGIQIPAEKIPESLPPIGFGMGGTDGSAHFALFIPAPVIKTVVDVGMVVQAQMNGEGGDDGMGGDDAPVDNKDTKPGAGQPRF